MATSKTPEPRATPSSAKPEIGDRRVEPPQQREADEERYARALESISHGVYDWDIVKGSVYYPPLMRSIFGMADDAVLTPAESGSRIHRDDLEQYRKAIIDHLKGRTPRLLVEYRYLASANT